MPGGSVKAFVVYARKDTDLKDRLLKHLEPLRLQGLISTWHDADIGAGENWDSAIEANMAESQLILLLVSPDFMASAYIQSKELAEALRRHDNGSARIVPIFLRPAYWEIANFAKLQGFPRDGQPVESSSPRTVDEALLEVARGIGKMVSAIGEPPPPPPIVNFEEEGRPEAGAPTQVSAAATTSDRQTSGAKAAEASELEFDEQHRDGRPFLRLVAYPNALNLGAVDIDSDDVKSLLIQPPGLRPGGWNVSLRSGSIGHWRDGIQTEGRDARLRLSESGMMEFVQLLERAFRWRETEDRFEAGPRLYPYPVIEYPLSFVTLYKNVIDKTALIGPFTFEMQYWDLAGWFLPPYLPGQVGFSFADDLTTYPDQHFRTVEKVPSHDFDPGEVTAALLRPLYRSFGHGAEAIPTYDMNALRLTFDLAQQ